MAEILIHFAGQPLTGDPLIDRHRWQRGDVVTIHADGWPWSEAEKNDGTFKVVKLPLIPISVLTQLLNTDPGYCQPEAEKLNRVLRRRTHKIDPTELAAAIPGPLLRLRDRVLAVIRQRAVLTDPAIIGPEQSAVRELG